MRRRLVASPVTLAETRSCLRQRRRSPSSSRTCRRRRIRRRCSILGGVVSHHHQRPTSIGSSAQCSRRPPASYVHTCVLRLLCAPRRRAGVFNLWSAAGPPVVRGELPRGPRATPEKLETRRILTTQKYRPYQCCRYRLQRTELKTSLVFAILCLKSELD